MAWGVDDADLLAGEGEYVAIRDGFFCGDAVCFAFAKEAAQWFLEPFCVVGVHIKWYVVARFQRGHCADVVPVAVGVDDELWREVFFIDEGCDALGFVAWIDENGLARGFIVDDVAIFFEWPDGHDFEFHCSPHSSHCSELLGRIQKHCHGTIVYERHFHVRLKLAGGDG